MGRKQRGVQVSRGAMKVMLLSAVLALTGCSGRPPNSFEVRVEGGAATGAELRICRSKAALARAGNRFTGADDRCEGSGEILVSFSDRPAVSCRIGYVTPGAAQSFRFVVKDGRCEPV